MIKNFLTNKLNLSATYFYHVYYVSFEHLGICTIVDGQKTLGLVSSSARRQTKSQFDRLVLVT